MNPQVAATTELEGVVASGLGEGAAFTRIDWVVRQIVGKLGFDPYPGTFNLEMSGAGWDAARAAMLAGGGVTIDPEPGYCGARCFDVAVNNAVRGVAVLPEVSGYPPGKLEIIAPVAIRQVIGVQNGDRVRLKLTTGGTAA